MRTTIDIDEVVLSAARARAASEGISLGRAVSDLALRGLTSGQPGSRKKGGFPVLKGPPGHPVTDEIVNRYRDDD